MQCPPQVTVVEVGTRDGFQMEEMFLATPTKVDLVNAIVRAGIRKLEVTSFVSPVVVPQLQDAAEVMKAIERRPGVTYMVLVPNAKGARRAVEARADAMKIVLCASDSYNQRNVGMTIAESLRACADVLAIGQANGVRPEAVIGLSFGCPLEGDIPPGRIVELANELFEIGYREISIADSFGLANPVQVRHLMRRLLAELPKVHFSMHMHNTRGLGLANILAAWEEGVDEFDSSFGGLGGSAVVVAGASGNVPTEDVVNMFHEMGVKTGIDLNGLMAASRMAQQALGHELPSYVLREGTREMFYRVTREREKSSRGKARDK